MEKLQAKGELGEEELRALEEDVTGKVGHTTFFSDGRLTRHTDHACLLARDPLRGFASSPRGMCSEQPLQRIFLSLAQVVDRVLKESGVSDQILYNRAKVR